MELEYAEECQEFPRISSHFLNMSFALKFFGAHHTWPSIDESWPACLADSNLISSKFFFALVPA